MTRRENWSLRDLFPIAVLVCIALAIAIHYGCEPDTTGPSPDPPDDGGQPLCTGKNDSPNCRLPSDAGTPPQDDTGSPSPDQGTVESPDDSQVPPTDTGTVQCPPAPSPYGEGAYCPAQDCILWQDPSQDCRWFCGLGPDGHAEPYRLYGRKGEQLPYVCDEDPEPCPPPTIPDGTYCDWGCTIWWDDSNGQCLSDCEGVFGDPINPEQMAAACGFGDPACPTPLEPLHDRALCPTFDDPCMLRQDPDTCLWWCGSGPDGEQRPFGLEPGTSEDFVLAWCFPAS